MDLKPTLVIFLLNVLPIKGRVCALVRKILDKAEDEESAKTMHKNYLSVFLKSI
jgi:uncharacterized membrane protein YesL